MADQLDRQESKPASPEGAPAETPEPPPRSGTTRRQTIQVRLISLVLACVLPVCLIAGLLIYYSYQQKRVLLEQRALEETRALSTVVDQELATMQAAATALAASPSLASGDFAAFYKQVQAVLRDHPDWGDVNLAAADGQQFINSYLPFGTPLPKRHVSELMRSVFETGKPGIANLYRGALTGRHVFGIETPVFVAGKVKYDLVFAVPAERLASVFSQQRIPPEWVVNIQDANHVLVARSRLPEEFVGKSAQPGAMKIMSEADEGSYRYPNQEGVDSLIAFHRSAISGWLVAAAIPERVLLADLQRWLWWMIGGALLLSMMGITLAIYLAERISGSIRALTGPALALGSGEPMNIGPLDLAEADEVGQSLVKATQLLKQRAEERDQAEQELVAAKKATESALAQLRATIDSMSEGMFVITPDRKRLLANRAYFRIYGFEPDTSSEAAEKVGSLLERYDMNGRLLPLEEQPASRALRGETVVQREVRVRRVDTGREVITSVNCVPVRDTSGKVVMAVITVEDITAHKQAEQHLAQVASFPELNPNPIFETDLEGKVTYANAAAQKLFPDLPEHGPNHPLVAELVSELASVIAEFTTGSGHVIIREVEAGGRFFLQTSYYLPQFNRVRVYFTDITERKRAEEALRESEQRLRLFIEHAPAALAMFDRDMRYLHVSRHWRTSYNLGSRRLHGVSHYQVFPEIGEGWKQAHRRGLAGEVLRSDGDRFERADGSVQWVRWEIRPWHVAAGEVGGIVIFTEDITESKRAQEELQLAKRHAEDAAVQLRSIVENMAERLFVCDSKGHLILMNEAFRRTYPGTDTPEFPRTFAEQWEAFDMAGNPVPVADWPIGLALRGQKVRGAEFRIRSKLTGKDMISSYNASPVFGPQGKVMMALFTSQDIDERKRAEAQLRRLNRTLTALNNSDQALLHAVDEEVSLPQVCAIVTEDCGYAMVWIGFAENDANKTVRPVVKAGFEEGYLDRANITWGENELGNGPTGAAIRTGQPQSCRNMLTDPKFEPWRKEALKRGYASSLVLPLILPSEHTAAAAAGGPDLPCGKVFGAITIYSREVDPFSADEVKLLSELAADLAYGIGAIRLRKAHALAEAALRASEERWATTLRSIGDAVISTCAMGKIIFMNDVAQKLTGWSLSEAKDRPLDEVFNIVNEVTRVKPESPVARVVQTGLVVGLANHTALIRRDGTEIPVEDSGAPIRDNEGNVTGVVLVFHDVSEQRKMQQAMRNSDRLATTGRLAATLAHEIHNPLDAVGGLLFLIQQSTKEAETQRFVSMASEELALVTQMTQQMLTFQRESTKPLPVQIKEILDNVLALYQRKIESASIQIEQEIDVLPPMLAQPGELRQVFANLLGNAIEAVGPDHGKIRLRAYISRDGRSGRSGMRVVFADNGCGIPAAAREKIFDPFFTTKGESGTGLGLWITSDIVRKYDGTMRLRSTIRPGRSGTCFSVFFPLPVSAD